MSLANVLEDISSPLLDDQEIKALLIAEPMKAAQTNKYRLKVAIEIPWIA
jgi:hypothetical protein